MKKKINKTAAAIGGSVSTEMPGLPKGFTARKLSSGRLINLAKLEPGSVYWGRLMGFSVSGKFGTPIMLIDREDNPKQRESVGASATVKSALKIDGDKNGFTSPLINELIAFRNNGAVKAAGKKRGFNDIEVSLLEK